MPPDEGGRWAVGGGRKGKAHGHGNDNGNRMKRAQPSHSSTLLLLSTCSLTAGGLLREREAPQQIAPKDDWQKFKAIEQRAPKGTAR